MSLWHRMIDSLIIRLNKINDDFKRSNNDGKIKDRYRKKSKSFSFVDKVIIVKKKGESNLNKSQTSSDDNTEVRHPGGSHNLETLGTMQDFGKTPKVGFESKLNPAKSQKFF